MKNLLTRSLSGIIYIAIVVGAVFGGSQWILLLSLIFCLFGTHEYHQLCANRNGSSPSLIILLVDSIVSILIWSIGCWIFYPINLITVLCFSPLILLVRFCLAIYDDSSNSWENLGRSVMGWFYIAAPLILLNFLSHESFENWQLMMVFILIWLNDTGAYCIGSTMGRHRLCERLSPKKSWEGFLGGMIFCIIGGIVYALCSDDSYIAWAIFGFLVSIMATLGDLFESMLKRSAGVKDSGKLIPGHGGVLDRIDSLLFVLPVAYAFLFFVVSLHYIK